VEVDKMLNDTLSTEFLNIYNEIDEYMRNKLNKGYGISHTDLIDDLSNIDYVRCFAILCG